MKKVSDLIDSPEYFSQMREGTWLYCDVYGLCRIAQVGAGVLAVISMAGRGCNRHSTPVEVKQPLRGMTRSEIEQIGAKEMTILQTEEEVKEAFAKSFEWPPHNNYGFVNT